MRFRYQNPRSTLESSLDFGILGPLDLREDPKVNQHLGSKSSGPWSDMGYFGYFRCGRVSPHGGSSIGVCRVGTSHAVIWQSSWSHPSSLSSVRLSTCHHLWQPLVFHNMLPYFQISVHGTGPRSIVVSRLVGISSEKSRPLYVEG